MIKCKYCNSEIEKDVLKCKHCSEPLRGRPKFWIISGRVSTIVALAALLTILNEVFEFEKTDISVKIIDVKEKMNFLVSNNGNKFGVLNSVELKMIDEKGDTASIGDSYFWESDPASNKIINPGFANFVGMRFIGFNDLHENDDYNGLTLLVIIEIVQYDNSKKKIELKYYGQEISDLFKR